MTNTYPESGSVNDNTPSSWFIPEPAEVLAEPPVSLVEYPICLKVEFDSMELGGSSENENSDSGREPVFSSLDFSNSAFRPMEELPTPDGYSAPQFEISESTSEQDLEIDALFSELAETASGQTVEIAVWCPWLGDSTHMDDR